LLDAATGKRYRKHSRGLSKLEARLPKRLKGLRKPQKTILDFTARLPQNPVFYRKP
jgi:hypothetical protein